MATPRTCEKRASCPPSFYYPPHWWDKVIFELDVHQPGFALAALQAAPFRKQLIAACLSGGLEAFDTAGWQHLAEHLLRARALNVLEAIFYPRPSGLLGALHRVTALQTACFYSRLHQFYRDPPSREATNALRHCGEIDEVRLEAAFSLPPALCKAEIFKNTPPKDLAALPALLRSFGQLSPASLDDAVVDLAEQLAKSGDVFAFVGSLLKRLRFPKPPLPGRRNVQPIQSAAELLTAARQLQNCLRSYVGPVLLGRDYFYDCSIYRTRVIAHLERDHTNYNLWVLEGVYGPQNEQPSPAVSTYIASWFAKRGVHTRDTESARAHRVWERYLDVATWYQNYVPF